MIFCCLMRVTGNRKPHSVLFLFCFGVTQYSSCTYNKSKHQKLAFLFFVRIVHPLSEWFFGISDPILQQIASFLSFARFSCFSCPIGRSINSPCGVKSFYLFEKRVQFHTLVLLFSKQTNLFHLFVKFFLFLKTPLSCKIPFALSSFSQNLIPEFWLG